MEFRDDLNRLTVYLSDDSGDFARFAERMTSLYGPPHEQIDGLDGRYWDFSVQGIVVVLHAEVFLGVMIYAESGNHDDMLREIAKQVSTMD